MDSKYEKETKEHYQAPSVAEEYHTLFTSRWSFRNFRHKIVAARERTLIQQALIELRARDVIDCPVGSGKLAPIFRDLGIRVTGVDISEDMLAIAERSFLQEKLSDFRLKIGDLTSYVSAESFDTAVCLRLMHRVPPSVRAHMLVALRNLAPNVIVTFAADSVYHQLRWRIRQSIWREKGEVLYPVRVEAFCAEAMDAGFTVVRTRSVLPLLSQEIVVILRAAAQ